MQSPLVGAPAHYKKTGGFGTVLVFHVKWSYDRDISMSRDKSAIQKLHVKTVSWEAFPDQMWEKKGLLAVLVTRAIFDLSGPPGGLRR